MAEWEPDDLNTSRPPVASTKERASGRPNP
jgi:hypothetical protein